MILFFDFAFWFVLIRDGCNRPNENKISHRWRGKTYPAAIRALAFGMKLMS